jgi:prepilin-type N-terminal cleavage/methylation domain-containing protein/prepilin-type processing-associated H-X9-DG protein
MKIQQPRVQPAFTLVEILVVIAIIGILAALVLPAVTRVKGKAQGIQCVNNLHQFGLAIQNFVAANGAYPSAYTGTKGDNPGTWMGQLEGGSFDKAKLENNILDKGVWRCPSAIFTADYYPSSFTAEDRAHFPPLSYGYNLFGVSATNHRTDALYRTNALGLYGHYLSHSIRPISESEVVCPSDMMAMGDVIAGGNFMREPDLAASKAALIRHQGKFNVVFCDGHVESPTLQFLFADTSDAALSRWNRDHQAHRERLAL